MMKKINFQEEITKIPAFHFKKRVCNHYLKNESRKDSFFSDLAFLYVTNRAFFRKLEKKINNWTKKYPSETSYALMGYVCYIYGNFVAAKRLFLITIRLKPENLDNWIDLAFTLRHLGETKMSNCILFHHDYVIYYFLLCASKK